jgi:hypothetical protein
MLHPFNYDPFAVELHLCELRAQVAQNRLARQARRRQESNQPRPWRRWVGALLIAVGEALVGTTAELACPDGAMESCPCA